MHQLNYGRFASLYPLYFVCGHPIITMVSMFIELKLSIVSKIITNCCINAGVSSFQILLALSLMVLQKKS
jgi:hypothetical protein